MSDKPREWWIDKSLTEAKGHIQQRAWASDFEREDCIRVVEYNAYEAEGEVLWARVTDQQERIAQLTSHADALAEGLQQYNEALQEYKEEATTLDKALAALKAYREFRGDKV